MGPIKQLHMSQNLKSQIFAAIPFAPFHAGTNYKYDSFPSETVWLRSYRERAWELMALADMPAKILSFKLRNYTIPAVQMSDRNKGLEGFHLAEL